MAQILQCSENRVFLRPAKRPRRPPNNLAWRPSLAKPQIRSEARVQIRKYTEIHNFVLHHLENVPQILQMNWQILTNIAQMMHNYWTNVTQRYTKLRCSSSVGEYYICILYISGISKYHIYIFFKLRCSSSAALARRPWVEAAEFQVLARCCNLMHYIACTNVALSTEIHSWVQIHRSTNTNT